MKVKTVPRFFEFQNYAALEPEQRAQRVLNKLRVPAIRDYLLQNPDSYVFSSITASYELPDGVDPDTLFEPFAEGSEIGILNFPMEADLLINDGQHRRAGIAAALEEDPAIGEDTISVVLFPFEDNDRAQQMFSDLNQDGTGDNQEPQHPLRPPRRAVQHHDDAHEGGRRLQWPRGQGARLAIEAVASLDHAWLSPRRYEGAARRDRRGELH